jgi:hypothetical protein
MAVVIERRNLSYKVYKYVPVNAEIDLDINSSDDPDLLSAIYIFIYRLIYMFKTVIII